MHVAKCKEPIWKKKKKPKPYVLYDFNYMRFEKGKTKERAKRSVLVRSPGGKWGYEYMKPRGS